MRLWRSHLPQADSNQPEADESSRPEQSSLVELRLGMPLHYDGISTMKSDVSRRSLDEDGRVTAEFQQ